MIKNFDDISDKFESLKKNLEHFSTPDKANDIKNLIQMSVDNLGQAMEAKLKALHETHRQEMEKLHQQQEAAMMRQALWQWVIVAGALVVAWLK